MNTYNKFTPNRLIN